MRPEQRAQYIQQPANLYAYMSGFVPRGTTEGRIGQFFECINRLGASLDGASAKLALGPAACVRIAAELDALIDAPRSTETELSATVGEHALACIMHIQRLVEADVAAQGWSYNYMQNFAYRTPHESGAATCFY